VKVLITGAGGFIGFHLCNRLSKMNYDIIGLDNINNYYDPLLKHNRLKLLGIDTSTIEEAKILESKTVNNFKFIKINLEQKQQMESLFEKEKFDYVIHLAAQAGVRHSLKDPFSYINSNIVGFMSILEACRKYPSKHLIYASSSSVYGLNKTIPFHENHPVDHPTSLYAATKISNEMMAHSYSYLFNIPVTGLRFFSVYGPWGRPDMAYFSFTEKILKKQPIELFNYGKMRRDFTYIDDIIEGIIGIIPFPPHSLPPTATIDNLPSASTAKYRIYNIGNNQPVDLEEFVAILEQELGQKAIKKYTPMRPEDVFETYADINELSAKTGFKPLTSLKIGLKKFVEWYLEYYKA